MQSGGSGEEVMRAAGEQPRRRPPAFPPSAAGGQTTMRVLGGRAPARRARLPPRTRTYSHRLRGARWPRACQENKARATRWNEETAALEAKGRTGKPTPRPLAPLPCQPVARPSAPGSARPWPRKGRGPFLSCLGEGGKQRQGRMCAGRCQRTPPGARARTHGRAGQGGGAESEGLPAA